MPRKNKYDWLRKLKEIPIKMPVGVDWLGVPTKPPERLDRATTISGYKEVSRPVNLASMGLEPQYATSLVTREKAIPSVLPDIEYVEQLLRTEQGLLSKEWEMVSEADKKKILGWNEVVRDAPKIVQGKPNENKVRIEEGVPDPYAVDRPDWYRRVEETAVSAVNKPLFEVGGVGISVSDIAAIGLLAYGGKEVLTKVGKPIFNRAVASQELEKIVKPRLKEGQKLSDPEVQSKMNNILNWFEKNIKTKEAARAFVTSGERGGGELVPKKPQVPGVPRKPIESPKVIPQMQGAVPVKPGINFEDSANIAINKMRATEGKGGRTSLSIDEVEGLRQYINKYGDLNNRFLGVASKIWTGDTEVVIGVIPEGKYYGEEYIVYDLENNDFGMHGTPPSISKHITSKFTGKTVSGQLTPEEWQSGVKDWLAGKVQFGGDKPSQPPKPVAEFGDAELQKQQPEMPIKQPPETVELTTGAIQPQEPPTLPKPPRPPSNIPPVSNVPILPSPTGGIKINPLQDVQTIIDTITRPNISRTFANLPGIKNIAGVISPSTTAETVPQKAAAAQAVLMDEIEQRSASILTYVNYKGSADRIFGKIGRYGEITQGNLKGKSFNEIAEFPDKYNLNDKQKAFLQRARDMENAIYNFLIENDIEIGQVELLSGQQYAGRITVGQLDDEGNILDIGYVKTGSKPGAKISVEKERIFQTIEEAQKAGYKYLPYDQSLSVRLSAAMRRVANKNVSDWVLTKVPYRTTAADDSVALAAEQAKQKYDEATKLVEYFKRALRGESLPGAATKIINKYPAYAKKFNQAITLLPKQKTALINRIIIDITKALRLKIKDINEINKIVNSSRVKLSYQPLGEKKPIKLKDIDESLREAFKPFTTNREISLDDISEAIRSIVKDKNLETDLVSTAYKSISQTQRDEIKDIISQTNTLLEQRQKDYTKAVEARARSRERNMNPKAGEGQTYNIPALQGKIFTAPEGREVAQKLTELLAPKRVNEVLSALQKVGQVSRFTMLAGDFSVMLIQLLMASGRPTVYGKAGMGLINGFIDGLSNGSVIDAYVYENREVFDKLPNLINPMSRANQWTEAFNKGGILGEGPIIRPASEESLGAALAKTPIRAVRAGVREILHPFEQAIRGALTVAQIEFSKIYLSKATTPEKATDIAQAINQMNGLTSTRRLGVSPNWRAIEDIGFLANRYNRAVAGNLIDAMRGATGQGGIRGRMAVVNLTRGIIAVGALGTAITLALGEKPEDVKRHLNPEDPDFLTWTIGKTRLGIGSKVRSLLRLAGQFVDDPESFLESGMDNPGLRWLRGNLGPVPSTGVDIFTGKSYLGEPTTDNVWDFSENVLGQSLVPIWIQSAAMPDKEVGYFDRIIQGAAEFVGGRAYPDSYYSEVKDLRKKYVNSDYPGKTWDELGKGEKNDLRRNHPDLADLESKAELEFAKYNSEFETWRETITQTAKQERDDSLDNYATALLNGSITKYEYDKERTRIRSYYSGAQGVIWTAGEILDPKGEDDYKKWIKENQNPKDKAMDEYYTYYSEIIDNSDLPIDWDNIEAQTTNYLNSLDSGIRDYILKHLNDWILDLPENAKRVELMRLQGIEDESWWDNYRGSSPYRYSASTDTSGSLREKVEGNNEWGYSSGNTNPLREKTSIK